LHKPRARPSSVKPFVFDEATRKHLATIFRRHQDENLRSPKVIHAVLDQLEQQAREFVEARPAAIQNSNRAVRQALQRLQALAARTDETVRDLPPRARDLLAGMGASTLEARKIIRALRRASILALADLAPNPKGGGPTDHRGQSFGATLAVILDDFGMRPTEYVDGPVAQIIQLVCDAVGHQTGDLKTLLKGVRTKIGDLPP
jgi:hypothetical protein